MAWSDDFIAAISDRATPLRLRYELEVTQAGSSPGVNGWSITSYGEGSVTTCQIGDRGVRVVGSTLSAGSWSSTLGQMEVDIVGQANDLLNAVTRGTFVVLYVQAWTGARWAREVLGYGQVQQFVNQPGRLGTLIIRDLLSALRCRPTLSPGQLALFYSVTSTTVATDYSPGDTTLNVVSTANFEQETGGSGAVLVTPSSGDDPFILRWGSTSGGVTFNLSDPSTDQHGTTRTNATTGDVVASLLMVSGHPIDTARKVLHSTGGGGNGDYDTLPADWGLGLPDAWTDHDDCDLYRIATLATMTWEVMADAEITDPWSWLSAILARGGFYLTNRQGKITVRGALRSGRPTGMLTSRAGQTVLVITDADVESGTVEAWDEDNESEVYNVTAYGPTTDASAGGEDPATLPAVYRQEYDLADLAFDYGVSGDEAQWLASIVDRVAESHQRIPERYALSCGGMRMAQLAPGDQVELDLTWYGGRIAPPPGGLLPGIVVQVSPDWGANRVSLVVLVYPQSAEVFA
ncbi:MAG: hypothetical protein EBR73_15110 [Rhodobacteraceae bacterium]|nr:hypothetical protein [Paracoccaceae bacterium]